MMQDTCIRQLSIIGESFSRVSESTKLESIEIPWKEIIGLRNIVIHQYFGVDDQVIWTIIHDELEPLKIQITQLLSTSFPI